MKKSILLILFSALILAGCASKGGLDKQAVAKPHGPKYSAYYQRVMDNSHKICNYIPQLHSIETLLAYFIADEYDDALAEHKISQAVAYICRAVNAAQRFKRKVQPQDITVDVEDDDGSKKQLPLGGQFTKTTSKKTLPIKPKTN